MDKKRTLQQNRALHLWYSMVSETLNEAGLDMKKTLKPQIDIPWSPTTVKEYLWRPIQEAYIKIKSTTQLERKQIDEIVNIIVRGLGEAHGVVLPPFPSLEQLNQYQYEEKITKKTH